MALTKARCTNCGGILEVDKDREAAICPFCNTPYIVEKAINQYKTEIIANGATINISQTALDADSMFENWLVSKNPKLEEDFRYYYATDPRNEYIHICKTLNQDLFGVGKNGIRRAITLAETFLSNQRYSKYKENEISKLNNLLFQVEGFEKQKKNTSLDKSIHEYKKSAGIILLVASVISLVLVFLYAGGFLDKFKDSDRERSYEFFKKEVNLHKIEEVLWIEEENRLVVYRKGDEEYSGSLVYYIYPTDSQEVLKEYLAGHGVKYRTHGGPLRTIIITVGIFLLVWAIALILVMRINKNIKKLSSQKI